MRAAIATEAGKPLELVNDLELRAPRAGEVRVRVHHCGLCHSDVTVRDSGMALPIVLGHEAAGVVEELGPASPASPSATRSCSRRARPAAPATSACAARRACASARSAS